MAPRRSSAGDAERGSNMSSKSVASKAPRQRGSDALGAGSDQGQQGNHRSGDGRDSAESGLVRPNSARNARTSNGIGPTLSPALARISAAMRARDSLGGGSR